MELMDDKTEKAIRLLTRIAHGDVSLVWSALVQHEGEGVEAVIAYIKRALHARKAAGEPKKVA